MYVQRKLIFQAQHILSVGQGRSPNINFGALDIGGSIDFGHTFMHFLDFTKGSDSSWERPEPGKAPKYIHGFGDHSYLH